jgi:HupE / UreJ protein
MGAQFAQAQVRSVSYSTWIVSGNLVTMRFLLPVEEARRLTGVAVPVLTTDKLKDYMLEHVLVQSAGGACPAIDQGYDLGRVDPLAVGPDLYGFELVYRCDDARQLVLRNSVLFGPVPEHVNFARIETHGQVVEQLFTAGHQQLALPDAGAPPAASLGAYLSIGFKRVLGSADRLVFLIGALLLARRWRDVGWIVLALVGGYALSLAVSSSGWVLPRPTLVEAFVGLLVALLGAAITLRDGQYRPVMALGWPGLLLLLAVIAAPLHSPWAAFALLGGAVLFAGFFLLSHRVAGQGLFWSLLVALFAFLDGFVMPAVLPPAQLPQWSQTRVVLGFDIGAVLIETLVVLGLTAAALLVLRARRIDGMRSLIDDVSAGCLSGLGTFWLVSRLWA